MIRKILFIDACLTNRSDSRTLKLCERFLQLCSEKNPQVEIEHVFLGDDFFQPLNDQGLAERNRLIAEGKFDVPDFAAARQFAAADLILIGAPYWDLAFPAQLKVYIENIMINKIVFSYVDNRCCGLCRAKSLVYIAAVGGYLPQDGNFGYNYLVKLSEMFGIPKTYYLDAQGLDVTGNDVSLILNEANTKLSGLVQEIEI